MFDTGNRPLHAGWSNFLNQKWEQAQNLALYPGSQGEEQGEPGINCTFMHLAIVANHMEYGGMAPFSIYCTRV